MNDAKDDIKTGLKDGFLGQKMLSVPKSMLLKLAENTYVNHFYLTDLGFYPNAELHYRKRRKGAQQYILIYCIKGSGKINIKGNNFLIKPNDFIIIPKQVEHSYRANRNNPWSIYWMHFTGVISDSLFKKYLENFQLQGNSTPFTQSRIYLFEKIFNLIQSNLILSIEYANVLAFNFINQLIYHSLESENLNKNEKTIIDTIKEFLNQNLHKRLTLNEIASEFNYSISHIHYKFRIKTGYAILDFFNLKKIQKACELLNYTDKSIKEISFAVGFENPFYFSRLFKKYMGKSPRNYRRDLHQ